MQQNLFHAAKLNGILQNPISSTATTGTPVAETPPTLVSSYTGDVTEISMFKTAFNQTSMMTLASTSLIRNTIAYNSATNDPLYAWIDEAEGRVVIKPQYNPYGTLGNVSDVKGTYIIAPLTNCTTSYKTGYSSTVEGISEVGLFNKDDVMVAYGTFPPVVYDQSKFHLSLNLLIQH